MPPETTTPSADWKAFRDNFWGKPLNDLEQEESVERGSDPRLDFKSLEKHRVLPIPPTLPEEWHLKVPEKFLVRSEYDEVEQEALRVFKDITVHIFVVNGTPGIGLFPSPSATEI